MTPPYKFLPYVLAALVLTACALSSLSPRSTRPTVGPIQSPAGLNSYVQIAASTNCASIGDIVQVTARIRNREPFPITLVGTPPLDIVIHPALWPRDKPRPERHWFKSNHYPASFDLTLDPGEEHTYVWNWKVDAVNASEPDTWVSIDFVVGGYVDMHGRRSQGGIQTVGIGVNRMPLAGGGSVPCSDLSR